MGFSLRLAMLAISVLMFSGCNFSYIMKENFNKTSRSYATMLRWQEFDAAAAYVDAPLREDYRKRIEAARGIRILDSRILRMDCDTSAKKGEVVMELDYNVNPSTRVKTVSDLQKWRYVDDDEKKGWRLDSLLPEFK